PLDRAQLLVGHFGVVRNAGRQARGRRLVPRRQAGAARQLADFVLQQIDFVERAAHAELARRLTTGPVVAAVVGVVAVDDDRAARARQTGEVRVQLVLAVVAAIRRIGTVLRPLELLRVNDLVAQAEIARDANGELSMAFGITGTIGRDRERAIAERSIGDVGEVGAVDAAAVRDDDRA